METRREREVLVVPQGVFQPQDVGQRKFDKEEVGEVPEGPRTVNLRRAKRDVRND